MKFCYNKSNDFKQVSFLCLNYDYKTKLSKKQSYMFNRIVKIVQANIKIC